MEKECIKCDGRGFCLTCDGYGYMNLQPEIRCPDCSGNGSCPECDGMGYVNVESKKDDGLKELVEFILVSKL